MYTTTLYLVVKRIFATQPNLPHGMPGWNKLQLSFLPSPSTDIPFRDLLKNW